LFALRAGQNAGTLPGTAPCGARVAVVIIRAPELMPGKRK
jgi:hypothetical protein